MLVFPPFELDVADERLWKAGEELPLRRKPFAILRYLAEHPMRLVTQQELVDAVWGEVAMSDSVLRTHIRDLRRVLGEDLIETVVGRGYRFLVEVTGAAPAPVRDAGIPAPAIAGREDKLEILAAALREALAHRRQMVFLVGDAGIGKTTVVDALLEHAAPSATIARGACVEQYGAGEAYLPVLDALGRACRGAEGERIVAVLARHAPSWLTQLPGTVSDDQLAELQKKLQGVTQARMLRELADALEVLGTERPFVLALEDLHWSDTSTVELLAMLGRRREPARLLVIGTLRRTELPKAHPLARVIGELVSHRQAMQLALEPLPVAAVDRYLAQRFRGHAFPDGFAAALHTTTAGHPLFLVAMLDDLERRDLVRPIDGRWALAVPLAEVAARRPESVMQLIDIQVDRLGAAEQRVLEAASIAGATFASAAVAAALEVPLADVDAACELLADEHPYLRRLEAEAWPDGSLPSRYGFTHAIYQHAAAARVSPGAERQWRRRVAECLEAGHRAAPASIAAELAMHFDRAQLPAKALAYYVMAGERSIRRSGAADALRNLQRAQELVERLPEGIERDAAELGLLQHLGPTLMLTKASPTLATYQRASELASRLGAGPDLARALVGMLYSRTAHGDLREVGASAAPVLDVVQRTGDPALTGHVELTLATAASLRGRLDEAKNWADAIRSSFDAQSRRPVAWSDYLPDPCLVAYGVSSIVVWLLGFPDAALVHARAGLVAAESIQDPVSIVLLLWNMTMVHMWRGEAALVREIAERGLAIARRFDFELVRCRAEIVIPWASARLGDLPESPDALAISLSELRTFSVVEGVIVALPCIEIFVQAGLRAQALDEIERSLAIVREIDARALEPELLRLRGEIVKADDPGEARRCFTAALELAESQRSRSFALRAATSLARLGESRAELRRIYDTFTEGFDTGDLVEARALLA